MAENAGRSRSSLQGVRRPVVAQVDSANARIHRAERKEVNMMSETNKASVQSIVRRLLANDQLRKVYDVDEDTLWECLRVLARYSFLPPSIVIN